MNFVIIKTNFLYLAFKSIGVVFFRILFYSKTLPIYSRRGMMEKNSRTKNDHNTDDLYHVSYENYLDTNACTECTGLMPNGADGRSEWDAYREIYDFLPRPVKKDDDR